MDPTGCGTTPELPNLRRRLDLRAVQAIPVLIGLVTALIFLPALGNDFVLWDDDKLLLNNPAFRGLGPAQLRWMATAFFMGHYTPLTWVTYGLDYVLWGMNPVGYHLSNLVLHAANAIVFYFVARRLLAGSTLGATVAALLFAVHPLRVESVAWVTERRDVLSGLGYLLAILAYLRACEQPAGRGRRGWYWTSIGVFALSLLAKGIGVTLPVILLILDVYPLRRLGRIDDRGETMWKLCLEKLPYLVLSAAASVAALAAQGEVLTPLSELGWVNRLAVASYGVVFYLRKTAVPLALVPLYQPHGPVTLLAWPFLGSMLTAVTISGVAIVLCRRWPALLAAWSVYVMTLLPVSGLFQAGPQMVADRYSYLATLAWAVLIGAGVQWCWNRTTKRQHHMGLAVLVLALTGLCLSVLGVLTWKQTLVWRNTETLWRHTLIANPSASAHNNLGVFLLRTGHFGQATEHFRQALQLNPESANAHANLGEIHTREGRWVEAAEAYRHALELKPNTATFHTRLGAALLRLGRWSEAVTHFKQALRLRPDDLEARQGLATALAHLQRTRP